MIAILKQSADFLAINKLLKVRDQDATGKKQPEKYVFDTLPFQF